jgi:acyl carrier protein
MAHVEPNSTSLSSPSGSEIAEGVRTVLKDHGRLAVDVETLGDEADLYQAGMTSHASVNLMLALEDHFDVEFPDHMLKRSVFESVGSISSAVETLKSES